MLVPVSHKYVYCGCIMHVCVQAIKQVQSDYEKRLKDVETQREQLLDEMESRETTLIAKVSVIVSA